MRNTSSKTRVTGCRIVLCAVVTGVVLAGCSGAGREPGRAEIDPAIALFVSGAYPEAIDRLTEIAGSTNSEETLREVYYYLGRSYLALGANDRAIEAFSAGVSYGDTGACVDYLEQLQAYVETREGSMRRSEDVSRRQLASGLLRSALGDAEVTATVDDPDSALRRVVERGWMRALPDGGLHGDAPVTRASLYVILSRVAADLGIDPRALDELRASFVECGAQPVMGPEVSALLDAISNARKRNGG
jgi:tetratricopeptide (TPR) repeat protein